MIFEILTEMSVKIVVFRNVTHCSLVDECQYFEEIC
jgi:hypothetical protein